MCFDFKEISRSLILSRVWGYWSSINIVEQHKNNKISQLFCKQPISILCRAPKRNAIEYEAVKIFSAKSLIKFHPLSHCFQFCIVYFIFRLTIFKNLDAEISLFHDLKRSFLAVLIPVNEMLACASFFLFSLRVCTPPLNNSTRNTTTYFEKKMSSLFSIYGLWAAYVDMALKL